MLRQEPHLELVGPDDVADQQIVSPVVSRLVGLAGGFPAEGQNQLVGLEQPGDLYRHFLPTARRTRNAGLFRDIGAHRQADTPEQLDPLGDLVHQLVLLLVMLVEQQVELVKRVPDDLPVRLLVEISQRDGVRQHLVERLDALPTDRFVEPDRQSGDGPVPLQLGRALARAGLGAGTFLLMLPRPGRHRRTTAAVASMYHSVLLRDEPARVVTWTSAPRERGHASGEKSGGNWSGEELRRLSECAQPARDCRRATWCCPS